jgi:hypothetical protein
LAKPGKPLVVKPKRTKNRPQWRVPDIVNGRRDASFPGYRSTFRDGVNRRQCSAMTRAGSRCCNDPLQGGTRCRLHGGHMGAYRANGAPVSKAALRRPRAALAAIGCGPVPDGLDGVPLPASPVDRGRLFESYLNRTLAPDEWRRETLNNDG